MASIRSVPDHAAHAVPAQLSTSSTLRRPEATSAAPQPVSHLQDLHAVGAPGLHPRPTLGATLFDCSIPDPRSMSLAALSMRGWQLESETWTSFVATDSSRPVVDAATLNPSEGERGREHGVSRRPQARRRLINSLNEVLRMLDDDDEDADRYVDGGDGSCTPAEAWARQ
jgi:hypothetical protein